MISSLSPLESPRTNWELASIVNANQVEPETIASHTTSTDPCTKAKQPQKMKKILSFSRDVQVHLHIAIDDISKADREAAWYSEKEYQSIRRSCCNPIRMMDKNRRLGDRNYQGSRGLEGYTKIGLMQKKQVRRLSIGMALEEQTRQALNEGRPDQESIARIYHQAASSCQLWARRLGLEDEKEAEEIAMEHQSISETLYSTAQPQSTERMTAREKSPRSVMAPLERPKRCSAESVSKSTYPRQRPAFLAAQKGSLPLSRALPKCPQRRRCMATSA